MRPIYFAMPLLLAGLSAWAQYPGNGAGPAQAGPPAEAAGAPGPGRGMARISLINGDVSVRRGDSGEVTAAAMNAPVGSGDAFLTGTAARAELQFDAASMVRIAASSEVRMGDLQYHHNQIQIAIGLVTFTVLRNTQSQNEIDTPNVAVHPRGRGAFRILVREDGTSEITVRQGEADIASAQGSQILKTGQTMMVRGSKDDPEFQIVNAIQEDDWDRWNVDRDRELLRSPSSRYVNPDVYGTESLDNNGRWTNDPQYGMVWAPTVAPDWAPYQQGRWVWADDYGWTWVSYDPWGWAPYHYGRWYHAGFGWAWWPGPVIGPAYWSPALVGFFGFGGGGFGVGFGFGNIGWVPLAPFELFHPWWGGGYGGFRQTVIVNNFNIYSSFRNARVAGGVTGVAAAGFGRGASGRFTTVDAGEIRSAGMVRGALPVTPDRASLRFSDRAVNMSSFRQARNTQFFTRSGSPAVRTTSFEQQRQMIQQASGRFGGNAAVSGNGFSRGAPAVPAQHGWSRFGEPPVQRRTDEAAVTHPLDQPAAAGAGTTERPAELERTPLGEVAVARSASARRLSATVLRKVIAPRVTARREAMADRAQATSMVAVPNPTAHQRLGRTTRQHRDPRSKVLPRVALRKAPRKAGVEAGAGIPAAAAAIIVKLIDLPSGPSGDSFVSGLLFRLAF